MQHPELGRTEYLPALCLPLVLVGLWDACHSARWRRGWLAGGLLAVVTMSGPTLALFAGPFIAAVGLWWSRPLSRVQRLRVLGSVLVPGVLGSAVAAVALWAWPPPLAPDLFTGASRELVQSVELASLVRLAPGTRELEMTPYLGLVGLPLALFGLVRRPRVLGFWAASVVALIAVGVGPYPTMFGQLLAGPTWVLTELVPPLRAVSGWPRVAWVMAIPMGVCAATGLQALGPRARLLGPFVVLGLCLDHATFPGPRFETRGTAVFSGAPPASVVAVVDALPVGPIFTLPAATPAVGKQCVMDSPWVVWSASLARPVTANQGRPTDGMATGSGFAAAVVRSPQRLAAQLARDGVSEACALAAVEELSEAGITGVVVETTLVRGRATRSAVEAVLGRPHLETGATVGWSLERVQSVVSVAGEACERRWMGGFPRE